MLTFKKKWSILRERCKLTERRGFGWYGFTLNRKNEMFFYGKTPEECVQLAEKKGWFDKYEN